MGEKGWRISDVTHPAPNPADVQTQAPGTWPFKICIPKFLLPVESAPSRLHEARIAETSPPRVGTVAVRGDVGSHRMMTDPCCSDWPS
jgi:hypothetical protein